MNTTTNLRRAAGGRALCGALALFTVTVASATARAADDRGAPLDPNYELVLRKSIFSRERARPPGPPNGALPTQPVRVLSPEQAIAFRGVLCPDEEYAAFVENVQTGAISMLKAGDEVAGGRIAGITLDSLAFDVGGKVRHIQLGQNLAGELAASASASGGGSYTTSAPAGSSGAAGTGTASSGTAAPVGDAAQQAIIERLRRQRAEGR